MNLKLCLAVVQAVIVVSACSSAPRRADIPKTIPKVRVLPNDDHASAAPVTPDEDSSTETKRNPSSKNVK